MSFFPREKEDTMVKTSAGKWIGAGGALLLGPIAIWLFVLGLGGSAAALYGFCSWLF
jgi:hypothetical protein